MKNSRAIKNQIMMVHVLRGIMIGLILPAVGIAAIAWLRLIGIGIRGAVRDIIGTVVFFALAGLLTGFLKGGRVMRPILRQDRMYAGAPFDSEHFREAASSGTFYLGEDWLLFHKDLNTKAWHRDSIDLIERTGAKSSGNKVGMIRLVSGKDEFMMTYPVSGEDLEAVLQHWLHPVSEPVSGAESMICPSCGTLNTPEAHFCAECGAPLTPAQNI